MFICNPPLTGSDIFASSGTYNKPTIVYNDGEGTVTIGAGKYRVFLTEDYSGRVTEFNLSGGTFSIGDNVESYLCVNYNNGSPLMYVETDESLIDDSSSVLVYTCSRIGTSATGFSYLDWDETAKSLPNKLVHKDVESQRFSRVYGLDISVDASRTVISTAGEVFTGVMERYFPEANSTTDECFLRVKDGTGWIRTAVTTYPNDKYDSGGTGLVDLTDGQYGVVWIYRDMGTDARIHFIMGRDSYTTVANAKTAPQPSDLDNLMRLDTILLAQVIFLKGQNTPTEINSAFATQFAPSVATVHNGLGGLQGGHPLEGEFYHLSLETHGYLSTVTSNIQTQLNGKEPTLTKGNLTAGSNKVTIGGSPTNAVIGTGVSVDVNPANILHNDLSTKQGGTTNEFYHLTARQYSGLQTTYYTSTTSQTIANTTTETTQIASGVGTLTIPANTLVVGSKIRCRTKGYISTGINQPATLRLKLGGATFLTSTGANLPNSLSDNYVDLDFEITIRTTGVSGTALGEGRTFISSSSGVGNPFMRQLIMTTPFTINTTVSNTFDLTYQWTNALAANSLTISMFTLEITG